MRGIPFVVAAFVLGACSSGGEVPETKAAPSPPERAQRVAATPEPAADPGDWRKPRYVPVRAAVARLARHVDVPVVLPTDRMALPGYRGWLADPKYTDWTTHRGETTGTLKLTSRRDYLWISYGYAIPDGCGDRMSAIPVDVRGDPALLWTHGRGYATIIWPVGPKGRVGRFGINGSFEGHEILRLAEAMETKIREAPSHDPGC